MFLLSEVQKRSTLREAPEDHLAEARQAPGNYLAAPALRQPPASTHRRAFHGK
jgi:hypothetical protein